MRKYLKYILVAFLISIIAFWFYLNREKGNPIENFNYFFNVFKEKYANFEVKAIDWQDIYNYYSEKVNERTTDEELFNIFQEFLTKLNDKHCRIYRFNQLCFSGFGLPSLNYFTILSFDYRVKTDDFSLKLIKKKYLNNSYEKSLRVYKLLEPPFGIRSIFTTGWLSDSIAYIHITEMSNKREGVHNSISDFCNKYRNAKGFIIDIRDNFGGWAIIPEDLAGRFTNKERIYAISRLRNPDSIFSFEEPEYWTIKPSCEKPILNKPIVLLVNKNTASSAELFTLRMKTIPNVIVIGNTTAGIFGDMYNGKLPNGWNFGLPVRKTNDQNDVSLEDIGIIPDILIENTKEDINNGKDKVIEYAIKYLSSGDKNK